MTALLRRADGGWLSGRAADGYRRPVNLEELTDEVDAVSRIYAQKYGIQRDAAWFLLKLQEEVGELTQAFLMKTGQGRDKGQTLEQLDAVFRAELADVLSQVLLLARHYEVDLEPEIEAKWLRWNPDWTLRHPGAATR